MQAFRCCGGNWSRSYHLLLLLPNIFQLVLALRQSKSLNGAIRPAAKLTVMQGEGFIAYLELAKNFGAVHSCVFHYQSDADPTPLDLNASTPLVTSRGENVLPYASDICGLRVSTVNVITAGKWQLTATNVHGDTEEDAVEITILPIRIPPAQTRVQGTLGQGTITCNTKESQTKHCHIVEPSTGAHWPNSCTLTTLMRENRTFECRTYDWGRMVAATERIVVQLVPDESIVANSNATQRESDTHLVLGCQLADTTYSCTATLPDRVTQLLLMDGLYRERYATAETQVSNALCELELSLPLQEEEQGLWRILNYNTVPPSGCLYYVGLPRKQIIEAEIQKLLGELPQQLQLYADKTTIESIECEVPFVVHDCFLRSPNNSLYFPSSWDMRRGGTHGLCLFRQLPPIAGTWTCGARGASYEKEVLQHIEVMIKSKLGEVVTEQLQARQGESARLMCRTAFDAPAHRCAFIEPNGTVHLVATSRSIQTAGRVQYNGRGLPLGDCGIQINQLLISDFGTWRCQFALSETSSGDSTFSMLLEKSELSQATSIGLGIGLTVMTILLAGVVIGTVFYRRRNLSAQHSFPSADPLQVLRGPSEGVSREPAHESTNC